MGSEEVLIMRTGIYSLLVNSILVAAKMTLAFFTGSLALKADAVHSLVDVFVSIALIIGLVISRRKSRNFPYGLYKIENLVASFISLLLFFTAYEILKDAIIGTNQTEISNSWILVAVAALILVPLLFGRYELNIGKKYNSPSLMADGSQFRMDVWGSSIVFAGLIGQLLGFSFDRFAAAIVALFIAWAAWGLLSSSMRVLLDASVSYDVLDKIRSIILAEPSVSAVRKLSGRNSGRFIFVEVAINVHTTDLRKAHSLTERIERSIKDAVPNVDRILIHCEPLAKTRQRYVVGLSNQDGQLSKDFGHSSYFALIDVDTVHNTVLQQEIVANPYIDIEKGRGMGIKIAEFILTYKPDIVVVRESLEGKGPGYALNNAGVEIRQTQANSKDELLLQLLDDHNKG